MADVRLLAKNGFIRSLSQMTASAEIKTDKTVTQPADT